MIQGLPRIPKMDTESWQARAKDDVSKIITLLMGKAYPVSFVQNSTGRGKDAKTLYRVKMESASVSRSIREKFGSFFSGNKDTRPEQLQSISIRNCVTPGTLARIAVLQLLGSRYKSSNVGSKFQVIGYEPRPLLKLIPSPDAEDKRIQVYNYVEAITKLPTAFSPTEIDGLLKRVSPKLHGSLKSTFGVLDDDMVRSRSGKHKAKGPAETSTSAFDHLSSPRRASKRGPSPSGSGSPSAKK
jgi:hypothetical protein